MLSPFSRFSVTLNLAFGVCGLLAAFGDRQGSAQPLLDAAHVVECAREGHVCTCRQGRVQYLAEVAAHAGSSAWRQLLDDRTIECSNAAFGKDPAPGHFKHCLCHGNESRLRDVDGSRDSVPGGSKSALVDEFRLMCSPSTFTTTTSRAGEHALPQIFGVYHVGLDTRPGSAWAHIFGQQLATLLRCGLLSSTSHLTLVHSGADADAPQRIKSSMRAVAETTLRDTWDKQLYNRGWDILRHAHLVDAALSKPPWEGRAMHELARTCREHPTAMVYYLHTKGASKGDVPQILHWRKYMEYFLFETDACLQKLLAGAKSCGVEKHGNHYSGNFFWAACAYVNTLPELELETDNYTGAEMWIGLGDGFDGPEHVCAHDTTENLYEVAIARKSYAKAT